MEYLVTADITFAPGAPRELIDDLLAQEAVAAAPYLESGQFARAWARYGTHHGSHGHAALWETSFGEQWIRSVYDGFPLVRHGYMENITVQPLYVNPNDPHAKAAQRDRDKWGDHAPVPLTWNHLWKELMRGPREEKQRGENSLAREIAPGVTIHNHPGSGNPRQIHFMVDGVKVAELGPTTDTPAGVHEDNVPRYIDFLADWADKPVGHEVWKRQIAADNGLVHPSYQHAKAAPRHRVSL